MSKAKHTEGPYFAGDDTGEDCPTHAKGGLAVIDTGRESDWPIARHVEWNNVPLLLAAPDLYEACKAIIDECQTFNEGGSGKFTTPPSNGSLERLRAAINKAEAGAQ